MRPNGIAIVMVIAFAIPAAPLAQGGRGGAQGQLRFTDKTPGATSAQGREVGLRPGEIENSRPLGFASYRTAGALRKLESRLLSPRRN